jgi:hypothetical protein
MTIEGGEAADLRQRLDRLESKIRYLGYLIIAILSGALALHAEAVIQEGWGVSKEVAGYWRDGIFLVSALLLSWRLNVD